MSDFSRFRSAFNGFSRTDVVNYIEETPLRTRRQSSSSKEKSSS